MEYLGRRSWGGLHGRESWDSLIRGIFYGIRGSGVKEAVSIATDSVCSNYHPISFAYMKAVRSIALIA